MPPQHKIIALLPSAVIGVTRNTTAPMPTPSLTSSLILTAVAECSSLSVQRSRRRITATSLLEQAEKEGYMSQYDHLKDQQELYQLQPFGGIRNAFLPQNVHDKPSEPMLLFSPTLSDSTLLSLGIIHEILHILITNCISRSWGTNNSF